MILTHYRPSKEGIQANGNGNNLCIMISEDDSTLIEVGSFKNHDSNSLKGY